MRKSGRTRSTHRDAECRFGLDSGSARRPFQAQVAHPFGYVNHPIRQRGRVSVRFVDVTVSCTRRGMDAVARSTGAFGATYPLTVCRLPLSRPTLVMPET